MCDQLIGDMTTQIVIFPIFFRKCAVAKRIFYTHKRRKDKMITSLITGKQYDQWDAVYITNPVQCFRYLDYLGPEFFLDILYSGERRKDALVYVWKRCPETKKAKELWDNHEL